MNGLSGEGWYQTPESRDYDDRRVSVGVPLAPDGSFRLDGACPATTASRSGSMARRSSTLLSREDEHPRGRLPASFGASRFPNSGRAQ